MKIENESTIKGALDAMYDKAIDHAIEIVQSELNEQEPDQDAHTVLMIIIIKLETLKSK